MLSRKNTGQLSALCTRHDHLIRDFENVRIEVLTSPVRTSAMLANFTVKLTLRDRIVAAQKDDPFLEKIKVDVGIKKRKGFEIAKDKALIFKGQMCVLKDEVLKNEIMTEAHSTPYAAHPGDAKHQRPSRPLNPIDILEWKWVKIAMDFIIGFPRSERGHDAIWVTVDRLMNSAHFFPVWTTYSLE
ncbi:uncharacterized protein LOC111397785 [Olea europaea var. sylvestris]|uniref:uncharacterized protein LOC111397785 n=1 Tax=Olea europaea var. sylvestris TaxID=158386 RepID=UPI000C1D1F49|nr:uncharacterized protein LOC111397785 [Olea europaea var. sylvestris]